MYLPKSKYVAVANDGVGYTLNGEDYYGPVIQDYLGNYYAGDSPDTVTGKLTPISEDYDQPIESDIVPGKRVPTEEEYAAGKMVRYFRQDLKTMKVIELLPDKYKLSVSRGETSSTRYKFVVVWWILTGILKDTKINNYPVQGVRSKNQATINAVEKKLPGIVSSKVLYDPEQFFRERS